ncbi:1-deoxy-D-xylulose-5-phosphate synthase [Gelria sp. Kuro-4]|uniref:1-deoxy-D-xylulose-5-phosphate synthase n=1 Tax=Gelria sp. Kuro-4 TaxID=2796927 RepID=UPI001BEDD71D|nr:1-deoxy-D-xylulose-5-phosphate synthase [Gelria sp. Kuro-4]BCV25114.1 1-deoxy-D-xylulose-5-phosphate synthase [Gelria sp. Kuro-4]
MPELLARIHSLSDLGKLDLKELYRLAGELREMIITTVAKNGGHLAPNLGVVELTVALGSVLNRPGDKIIWDVGHQAYAYKLLTGRRERFSTLRRPGGLSGYPRRSESPYDYFGAGHSSTSLSAALGFAIARDLAGDKGTVCAVIGDGSLTAGMAFEALNHAGQLRKKLIVVLNDNEMSISKNVGALAAYLTRLRSDPGYFRLKEDLEFLLKRIPAIGPQVARTAERVKDAVRFMLVPGTLFEELGFTYLGPIDGHDIGLIRSVISRARHVDGPVLVHVLTKKGKGYPPAEKSPDRYHGVGPFVIKSGAPVAAPTTTYTDVFGQALVEEAEKNPRIVAICAAMSYGTGLSEFARRFPDRFFDVGIAEQHAVTLAAALAAAGLRPVVAIYSTFLQRAYDQVLHDVCLQNLPVVFCLDRAGLVGEDGATHQGLYDLAYLRHIPNMSLAAPRDAAELRHMLALALARNGPVAIRYPRAVAEAAYTTAAGPGWGEGEVLREGRDGMVLAVGSTTLPSLRAARRLEESGIRVGVTDVRFIKPLPAPLLLALARRYPRFLTVEDHALAGGFGSAVLELFSDSGVLVPVKRLGIGDKFVEHASRTRQLCENGLDEEGLREAMQLYFGSEAGQQPVALAQVAQAHGR